MLLQTRRMTEPGETLNSTMRSRKALRGYARRGFCSQTTVETFQRLDFLDQNQILDKAPNECIHM